MNIKSRPDHKIYIRALRNMTPEKRHLKAFELSDFDRVLFIHGFRRRFPDLPEDEFKKIFLSGRINVTTGITKKVILALDQTGIPYMITGSLVSSLQGKSRATHDTDMVIAITKSAEKN